MRAGLIGVGYIGVHHLRNLVRLRDEGYIDSLVASDIDVSKRSVVEDMGAKYYRDYREMLSKEDIDILSIASPTKYHCEMALNAIDMGINVLIEKPITYSLDEAYKIKEAAVRNNVVVMVGHIERFNPAVMRLKRFIKDGEAGRVISLSSRRLGGPRIVDVGVILDLALHDIDVMLYLTGKRVRNVYANALKRLPEVVNEDYVIISLVMEGDILGRIEASRITPVKIRELDVNASKCYIRLDYLDQRVMVVESFLKQGPSSWSSFQEFIRKFSPYEREIDVEREEPLYIELRSFIESIDKNSDPPVTVEDAIETLRIAYAAEESYRSNSVVSL
jgi:UDP-N-acetylglucosamine 3-dehydrogenase